jgi:hypothetical protein
VQITIVKYAEAEGFNFCENFNVVVFQEWPGRLAFWAEGMDKPRLITKTRTPDLLENDELVCELLNVCATKSAAFCQRYNIKAEMLKLSHIAVIYSPRNIHSPLLYSTQRPNTPNPTMEPLPPPVRAVSYTSVASLRGAGR